MPSFWEFPTVSMALGPINAIYQARYVRARGIADTDSLFAMDVDGVLVSKLKSTPDGQLRTYSVESAPYR